MAFFVMISKSTALNPKYLLSSPRLVTMFLRISVSAMKLKK